MHRTWLVLAAALAAATLSMLFHAPLISEWTPWKGYSDIIHGVFYRMYDESYWRNIGAYKALMDGLLVCPIPYRDYHFEYPPVVAYIWLVSSCAGFAVSTGLEGFARLVKAAPIHYAVEAAILVAAWGCFAVLVARVWGVRWYTIAAVAGPSVVMYLCQNWDGLAALFTMLAVLSAESRRWSRAGVYLALATGVKLLPASLLPPLAVLAWRSSTRSLYRLLASFTLVLLVVTAPWVVAAPRGFVESMLQHAEWYCENCIYMLVVNDIFSPIHHAAAYVMVPSVLAVSAVLAARGFAREALYTALAGSTTFNYVFTPQMMLLLTPLYPVSPRALLAADAANSLIIPLFLNDDAVRAMLGLEPVYDPWRLPSPAQIAAQTRNLILASSIAFVASRLASRRLGRG